MDADIEGVPQEVSTGSLPAGDRVQRSVDEAHARYRDRDEGEVIDSIPELAEADPALFGLAVAPTGGDVHAAGDADVQFTIQSISKAFVYALVCEAHGHDEVLERVGVDNTGYPFDSVVTLELNDGHPKNPMVNAGALATTALVPGDGAAERWEHVRTGLSAFAGRRLEMDDAVHRSESAVNQRTRAIAQLLESYGRITTDPLDVVDVYTRQCALLVSARDLAVMGATLANGGVNPLTGERTVSPHVCRDVLSVLAVTGMYEKSGDWLFGIGMPAKSGISGGIVAVAPGKGALGAYSPQLDSAGNSVRGQLAAAYLSRTLGLNVFASSAAGGPRG
ncbi:glutaminase A [Georgenia satyanarayanai]|uniref:glutaminase A n=1 Tax=Georgenia satyanarayanai TaxID=860221 RepID=UPI001D02C702|nr:glutaminase A [Georgenia satyanarayanai]